MGVFCKQKVCWHYPEMFCLIISSKLLRQWFEFSLKVKVIRSNPEFLNLFYLIYNISFFESHIFWCQNLMQLGTMLLVPFFKKSLTLYLCLQVQIFHLVFCAVCKFFLNELMPKCGFNWKYLLQYRSNTDDKLIQ